VKPIVFAARGSSSEPLQLVSVVPELCPPCPFVVVVLRLVAWW